MCDVDSTLKLVPLYDRRDLHKNCVELLNEEWKRSESARSFSLQKSSNPHPPMSFILLQANQLIGHARLLPIYDDAAWIESVVIAKRLRGKGLGRKLMYMMEDKAKMHGFHKIYLSTDKHNFYRKCGYELCDPIFRVNYCHHSLMERAMKFRQLSKVNEVVIRKSEQDVQHDNGSSSGKVNGLSDQNKMAEVETVSTASYEPPPPPPLPQPPAIPTVRILNKDSTSKAANVYVHMCKDLR